VRDDKVRAFLDVEGLLKVHFGIFGFTGAGKSNLLSTLIQKLLTKSTAPVKIIIFDLMGEYTGLLVDQLVTHLTQLTIILTPQPPLHCVERGSKTCVLAPPCEAGRGWGREKRTTA
jgi:hypothetical protein